MIKISVIVPAYNEAGSILDLLKKVNAQSVDGFCFEIIVIDDGSTDGTGQLLKNNGSFYSELILLDKNGGKGSAVKAGLQKASGEYVLFQDADLEYDPDDYCKLFLPITKFQADVVMGSRMIAPQYTRVSYFWNKVGNKFITFIFNFLNNKTFTDIYSCYLLFRRDLVNPNLLQSSGWDQQAEILSICSYFAKRIYEVPISYHGRSHGEGKKIRAHHAISVILMIFKKWILRNRNLN